MRDKKRQGCLRPLLILLIAAVLIVFGWLWLKNAAALIPDRDREAENTAVSSEDKLYILLAGSDRTEELDSSRTDTIILACIDFEQGGIYLLSIPRDTYAEIPGHGEDKINHAYAYGGIDLLRESVTQLTGVPVDYYALVDFSGFEQIIDALGGVEINVDKRMYYQTYDALIDIEAGLQRLDGQQALQYVRYRSDALGDITRVSRQQNLLKAVYTEFTENNGILKLPQIIPAVNQAIETDLSYRQLARLAVYIRSLGPDAVSSDTLPGNFWDSKGVSYWQSDGEALAALIAEKFGSVE